jgi:hypothetical protein
VNDIAIGVQLSNALRIEGAWQGGPFWMPDYFRIWTSDIPLQTDTNHDGGLSQIAASSGNMVVSRVLECRVSFGSKHLFCACLR